MQTIGDSILYLSLVDNLEPPVSPTLSVQFSPLNPSEGVCVCVCVCACVCVVAIKMKIAIVAFACIIIDGRGYR